MVNYVAGLFTEFVSLASICIAITFYQNTFITQNKHHLVAKKHGYYS